MWRRAKEDIICILLHLACSCLAMLNLIIHPQSICPLKKKQVGMLPEGFAKYDFVQKEEWLAADEEDRSTNYLPQRYSSYSRKVVC